MATQRKKAVSAMEDDISSLSPRKRTRAKKSPAEFIIKEKFAQERQAFITPITAKTENQKKYLDSLQKNTLTVGRGSAGTGKTWCAASVAANKYLNGDVKEIVVMRSATRMGTNTGFYPGTVEDKLLPFLAPILNTIKERIGSTRYDAEFGKSIKIQPIEAVRGMSFCHGTYIIVDEAQNLLPEEVRSLVTRLEEGAQVAFCGDDRQKDIRGLSGIVYLCDLIKTHKLPSCGVVEFTPEDIVRSGLTRRFVEIFESEGSVDNVEKEYKNKLNKEAA